MKKIKQINLLNGNDDVTNLNNMDFVVLDNNGELSLPDGVEMNAEEFSYHLTTIISNYKNLINLSGSKSSLIQNLSYTIH